MEKGDHPELDNTDCLDFNGIAIYQSMLGSLQWSVSLCRIDIQNETMSMSSFRSVPKKVHLDRVKQMYSYVSKMRHVTVDSEISLYLKIRLLRL